MPITRATSEKIAERLKLYLSGEEQKWRVLDSTARELGALPILNDWFIAYFLRPDGEMLTLDQYDESTKPEIEKDRHTRITVLNVASEWFPELKDLLPDRANDASDCPDCSGLGKLLITDYYGQPASIACPKCMTLGWVQ